MLFISAWMYGSGRARKKVKRGEREHRCSERQERRTQTRRGERRIVSDSQHTL